AEIGPKDTALFHHGISALLDILAEVGIGRLRRRLQAIAFNIEQPAVEGTAQAPILQAPECKIRPAMWTVPVHEATAAFFVTEQNEILAKKPNWPDGSWAFEFINQGSRLPIFPHQLASGGGRADPCDQIILLLAHHGCEFLLKSRMQVQ